jgi:hydrogenase expression/formation protein HypC
LTKVKQSKRRSNKILFSESITGVHRYPGIRLAKEKNNMCLGVPMRIIEIEGFQARCEARGIERQANLFLLQHEDLKVGDMVMIHVGNAIQKMSEEEARSAWELYDEMLERERELSERA